MNVKLLIATSLLLPLLAISSLAHSKPIIAYDVESATPGAQEHPGTLGMDFVVNSRISVSALGVFDDMSDGLNRDIVAQLWSRNGNEAGSMLASHLFSGAAEELRGGNRFFDIAPKILMPGEYSIVAFGYGVGERNGNCAIGGCLWSTNDGGGSLSFSGFGRYSRTVELGIGSIISNGPENRYAAGTFIYQPVPEPATLGLLMIGIAGIAFTKRAQRQ